jgi:hypothetical protein
VLDYSHIEMDNPEEDWYEAYMDVRARALRDIFGEEDAVLRPADPDTRRDWPGGAFFCFPPRGRRKSWHYATHGLSQPHDLEELEESRKADDRRVLESGFGVECVISTHASESWPGSLLEQVVNYINGSGRTIDPGDRLPSSNLMHDSPSGGLLAVVSPEYDNDIMLPAGRCQLIHLAGITGEEMARAKRYKSRQGSRILAAVLQHYGHGFVTDRNRNSVTTHPDFPAVWKQYEAQPYEWPIGEAVR